MDAIEIERSQPLVVVVRFNRGATDAECEQFLRDYSAILDAEPRFAAVFVSAPNITLITGRQARMHAQFMKDRARTIAERVAGVALSLPSPLSRGVLRAILKLQPMPCPHAVVASEAEGVDWVKARLWKDHVQRMNSSQR